MTRQQRLDEIRALMESVRVAVDSAENERRRGLWVEQTGQARDHWRGVPRPRSEAGCAPLTIEPENAMWARLLGFNLKDYYTAPLTYLAAQLRMKLYHVERLKDDSAIGKEVPIWLGVPFEPSLFGMEVVYEEDKDPWIGRRPILENDRDLGRLSRPDFRSSGLMPVAHRMYEEIGQVLDEDFSVVFPEWGRSPFAVALHLRGMDQILADMVCNPSFVHELVAFITACRNEWTEERARFLGQPIGKANLYDDEVNCPLLSPGLYEECVLPYEMQVSEFCGGVAYWHSCGDTTKLVSLINRIPGLEMFHVGPWTSVREAAAVLRREVALEVCLHPLRDVQDTDAESAAARLEQIAQDAGDRAFTVRADGLQVLTSPDNEMARISRWREIARGVLAGAAATEEQVGRSACN